VSAMNGRSDLYGLLAEFDTPELLVRAARESHGAGFHKVDAFSPYPIEEAWEELGHHRSKLPAIVLAGGVIGCLVGFFFQYWVNVIYWPLNIGGRPFNSWPAFIPVTFECTILFAALAAVLGMLALNGLPMPYHPVFNVRRFALASKDRYFLCIEARDPQFDPDTTRRFLESLNAVAVTEVTS
jgi:hypothetical protein